MEAKRLLFQVYGDSIVKVTKSGNVTDILFTSLSPHDIKTQKINKDEFVYLDTGEIKEYNHISDRSEDLKSIRQSITKLRNLINKNFEGGKNDLWITLTFGDNKIYNPKELQPYFQEFIRRLRNNFKNHKIDYIYVPEPHEKGDWHIHLLLKSNQKLYISNKQLNEIWGNGFVKVNRLNDIDNVGAYVSAYLINIKDGEQTKKGARLNLYPPNHKLYRCSKGILQPDIYFTTYKNALRNLSEEQLTYKNTLHIETDTGYENTIHRECYNSKIRR